MSWAWRRNPATVPAASVRRRRQRPRDVEGRVVHRRQELVREERAHDLPHLVGRDHVRDAEPRRELGRDGRLARRRSRRRAAPAAAARGCARSTTGGSAPAPARSRRRRPPPRPRRAARRRRSRPTCARRAAPRSAARARTSARRAGRSPSATAPSGPWSTAARSRCARPPSAVAPRARSPSSRRAPPRPARAARVRPSSTSASSASSSGGSPGSATGRLRRKTTRAPARARRLGDDVDRGRLQLGQEHVAALAQRRLDVARRAPRAARGWRRSTRDVDARAAPSPARSRRSASGRAVTKHATRASGGQRLRRLGPQLARDDPLAGRSSARGRPRGRAASAAASSAAPSSTSRSERSSRSGPEVRQRLRARAARRR